jgi:hypothetical protein
MEGEGGGVKEKGEPKQSYKCKPSKVKARQEREREIAIQENVDC